MSADSGKTMLYGRGGSLLAVSIFLGAFLIFQVQPLIAKFILPWFGGSTGVWVTCMLFFQVALLIGYAYAHFITHTLSLRQQAVFHTTLLFASLVVLPIAPDAAWKPNPGDNPTLRILALLTVTVAPPFLLLSSTGPLLQRWFSQIYPDRSPYRLYALSNIGSLLALLTYPVVVEPLLRSRVQTLVWSSMYAVFFLLVAGSAWRLWKLDPHTASESESRGNEKPEPPRGGQPADGSARDAKAPSGLRILVWIALSTTGSIMLLATTNQICQNIASVPFLWILPLSLYLLTFILCFDADGWYRRDLFLWIFASSLVASGLIVTLDSGAPLAVLIGVYSYTLFASCMICHGELVRLRPGTRHLTLFYLMLSLGGALGGVFVSILAPLLFDSFLEFNIGLLLCCALSLLVRRLDALESRVAEWKNNPRKLSKAIVVGVLVIAMASAFGTFSRRSYLESKNIIAMSRDFYGVLRVFRLHAGDPDREVLRLSHGSIQHGLQFSSAEKRRSATAYYGEQGGAGIAIHTMRSFLETHPRPGLAGLKVGSIGLGVGTVAVYADRGDSFRFYEISPQVGVYASEYFSFLGDATERGADVKVLIGDARLLLERELAAQQAQRFDVLVVDAFSGDAVPVHLLTRECFEVYWRHLDPNGVLAIHVSNQYVDLAPVVRGIADQDGVNSWPVHEARKPDLSIFASDWILVSRNDFFAEHFKDDPTRNWPNESVQRVLWSDDFSSLYQVLK